MVYNHVYDMDLASFMPLVFSAFHGGLGVEGTHHFSCFADLFAV